MNEQQLEDLCMGWFRDTGWQFVHGPNIAPDATNPERADYRQVLLSSRLLRSGVTVELSVGPERKTDLVHLIDVASPPHNEFGANSKGR